MGYSFVDHTADVAADLTGRTLDELFQSAAQALTDTITELSRVQPLVTQSVTLESASLDDLLVDWLNELLYRCGAPGWFSTSKSIHRRRGDQEFFDQKKKMLLPSCPPV